MKGISLFITLVLMCSKTWAVAPLWQVRPTVCVSNDNAALCEMQVLISTSNLPEEQFCLFQDVTLVHCWNGNLQVLNLQVRLQNTSKLQVKNSRGDVILNQALSVKAQYTPQFRRRLKDPWALF